MKMLAVLVPVAAAVGLLVALLLALWIKGQGQGNDRMKEISGYIRIGAMTFLKREYRVMTETGWLRSLHIMRITQAVCRV